MKYKIISFYTPEYEKEKECFEKSCKKFDLNYEIEKVNLNCRWEKRTQYKADFILCKLDMPVIWLDIDSEIIKYPKLFENLFGTDIGYHKIKDELLSGTLYVNNNSLTRRILKDWIMLNSTNKCWDQKNLQQVLKNHTYREYIFPASYCHIVNHPHQEHNEIVIDQKQASRKYKKEINERYK